MARLPAGFAIALVVEHNDGEIARLLRPTVARLPNPISISPSPVITTTGSRVGPVRAQSDHDGPSHAAPQIKIAVVIAGRRDIIGRGAQPADHEGAVAIREQAETRRRSRRLVCSLVKTFAPIRRCDRGRRRRAGVVDLARGRLDHLADLVRVEARSTFIPDNSKTAWVSIPSAPARD